MYKYFVCYQYAHESDLSKGYLDDDVIELDHELDYSLAFNDLRDIIKELYLTNSQLVTAIIFFKEIPK